LIALGPERAAAQASASTNVNTSDKLPGIQDGRSLFQLHCSYCHGANGEGGRGADLTIGKYRLGGSDTELFGTVRNGIPGTEMPAVRASDDEVWKMVTFVKTIGAAGLGEKAPGDRGAGKVIFEGKGRCMTCHSVGRDGGTLGPELSDVGRRRNLMYLEESLLRQEADVAGRYRAVALLTESGQQVEGLGLQDEHVGIPLRVHLSN